jgi:hypothetical protein
VYAVRDGNECLALDLTDENRFDIMELASFPRGFLLYSFFQQAAIRDLKQLYGIRTCRVHKGERDRKLVDTWMRDFDRVVDPLLALAKRWINRCLGTWTVAVFRFVCILDTYTLGFILGQTPFLLRKWKMSGLPNSSASARHRPSGRGVVFTN